MTNLEEGGERGLSYGSRVRLEDHARLQIRDVGSVGGAPFSRPSQQREGGGVKSGGGGGKRGGGWQKP